MWCKWPCCDVFKSLQWSGCRASDHAEGSADSRRVSRVWEKYAYPCNTDRYDFVCRGDAWSFGAEGRDPKQERLSGISVQWVCSTLWESRDRKRCIRFRHTDSDPDNAEWRYHTSDPGSYRIYHRGADRTGTFPSPEKYLSSDQCTAVTVASDEGRYRWKIYQGRPSGSCKPALFLLCPCRRGERSCECHRRGRAFWYR